MNVLNEDRITELTKTVENIVQDAHNKAIGDCHHMILGLYDEAGTEEKDFYCELEKKVVELYKQ